MTIHSLSLRCLTAALFLAFVTGCATKRTGTITGSEPLAMAEVEIPESQLMDVGIQIFSPSDPTSKGMERSVQLGSSLEVQEAEAHFIPYHLKGTMQRTGNWGAVRVTPVKTDSVDIFVEGQILESSGEALSLAINVSDTSGRQWFTKTYTALAEPTTYTGATRGELDAFQNVYNSISNDILAYKNSLPPREISRLRTISQLKFAADLAPDAFGDHLATTPDGQVQIMRLPAEGDWMLERLMNLREREYMLVDVMNEHYEDYYVEMWEPYKSWRELSLEEAANLKQVKDSAFKRKLLGGAAIAGAIALEVLTDGQNTGTLRTLGVIGGIEAIKSGIQIGQEATFHREALTELGDSFAAEMSPRVVQVEGETEELSGTAKEQYAQWRGLLRKIYAEETGFPVQGSPVETGDDGLAAGAPRAPSEPPPPMIPEIPIETSVPTPPPVPSAPEPPEEPMQPVGPAGPVTGGGLAYPYPTPAASAPPRAPTPPPFESPKDDLPELPEIPASSFPERDVDLYAPEVSTPALDVPPVDAPEIRIPARSSGGLALPR